MSRKPNPIQIYVPAYKSNYCKALQGLYNDEYDRKNYLESIEAFNCTFDIVTSIVLIAKLFL